MSALIPWLVSTFGPLGGALVFIVLVLVGVAIARYLFWTILMLAVAWYVGVDTDALRRDIRRDDR
jgi:hypothetical protein